MIFVSSVVGLSGSAGQVNYAASKAGLVGLARSVARELGSRGITANVVAPGPVATDFSGGLLRDNAQLKEHIASVTPLGRIAEPHEVAAAVAFLALPAASYITGQCLAVDGGMSIQGLPAVV